MLKICAVGRIKFNGCCQSFLGSFANAEADGCLFVPSSFDFGFETRLQVLFPIMGAPEIEKTTVADSPRSKSPTSVSARETEPAVAELVQDNPKLTWRSYVWDTLDKSPEERKFMFKLDAVILTFASLGYFIK